MKGGGVSQTRRSSGQSVVDRTKEDKQEPQRSAWPGQGRCKAQYTLRGAAPSHEYCVMSDPIMAAQMPRKTVAVLWACVSFFQNRQRRPLETAGRPLLTQFKSPIERWKGRYSHYFASVPSKYHPLRFYRLSSPSSIPVLPPSTLARSGSTSCFTFFNSSAVRYPATPPVTRP